MLMFGLRLGTDPRVVVTTTPRPTKLIRALIADPRAVVRRGSPYENRANLAPAFLDQIIRKYEGTRLGRQEIEGRAPRRRTGCVVDPRPHRDGARHCATDIDPGRGGYRPG